MNTVNDIREILVRGPWKTKSDGELSVLMAFSQGELESYFKYEGNMEPDIRGLRIYMITGLKEGKRGGGGFHKIRQEIILCLHGLVKLEFRDLNGSEKMMMVDKSRGIYFPSHILHSYEVLKDATLLVIANTLFDPENPLTFDSFPMKEFKTI